MRGRDQRTSRIYRQVFAAGIVVVFAGLGTAALALTLKPHKNITFVPDPTVSAPASLPPGLPTLSKAPAVAVQQAFGPDDEDCIVQTRTFTRPGVAPLHAKKLICRE